MKKIKSIVVLIMVITATLIGFTACKNCCKKDGKCEKEMCCSKDCCKDCNGKECCEGKNCKEKCEKMCSEGKCCKKDSAKCDMKDDGMKKECCKKDSTTSTSTAKEENNITAMYSCPMHKEVTSDKPGKCPKCGMTLVKK